jgi:hypothetical protein
MWQITAAAMLSRLVTTQADLPVIYTLKPGFFYYILISELKPRLLPAAFSQLLQVQ